MFVKFLNAAVFAGTPLLFGTTGEMMNEKAGHLNLGVEGMMAMGACAGFMAGYFYDSILIALLAAFLAGMLGALIYALLTITFMANQCYRSYPFYIRCRNIKFCRGIYAGKFCFQYIEAS
jgi:ABC-type uncharacterized transport system permease subunit